MCQCIVACAVVHNFIIVNETVDVSDIVLDDDDSDCAQEFQHRASASAVQKRLHIAALL